MDIIALNLPKDITQEELTALFAPHGKVSDCTLVMDKATQVSKGFGFVTMPDESEANEAIKVLHGSRVRRHKIRVKPSESKKK